jgi:multiple antibiotic resistance protein
MLDYLFHATVTLFVTIDPIGLAPVFLGLTAGRSALSRRKVGVLASIIAAAVLIGASLVGEWLLQALGISLPAFLIAGGLLLFLIAVEMLFDLRTRRKAASVNVAEEDHEADTLAAFPLAVPLMAGPGAISATILTAADAPNAGALAGLDVVILVIIGLSLLAFLAAEGIQSVLRPTGRVVLSRLLGLVLAALSVQFVADGIKAIAQMP